MAFKITFSITLFSALIVIINNSSICEFLSVSLITHSFQRFIFLPWWNEFFIELTSIYECFPASNFKTSPASYKGHFKWVDSRKDQKTVPAIVRILSLSPYNWHFVQLSCEQKHDRYFLEIIKFQKWSITLLWILPGSVHHEKQSDQNIFSWTIAEVKKESP